MREIGQSGRGPYDAWPDGARPDVGARSGSAPDRERRAGGPREERRIEDRAGLAERARLFGARLGALKEPGGDGPAAEAGRLVAVAEWRGSGAAAAQTSDPAAPAPAAPGTARTEAIADTVAERVERALAQAAARPAGEPLAFSIGLDGSVLGLGRIDIALGAAGLDLVLVRDPAAAAVDAAALAGAAADLAQRLARRFEGRRVTIRETVEAAAPAEPAAGGGLAAIAAILGGTDGRR